MVAKVTVSITGREDLNKKFSRLSDFKGTEWKSNALSKSGKIAMNIITAKMNSLAPIGKSGLARKSMAPSKDVYNRNFKLEYAIWSTLSTSFIKTAQKDRKGMVKRYPFMLSAGVKAQTYTRISASGQKQEVSRKATRATNFIGRGAALSEDAAIKAFGETLLTELDKFEASI